MQGDYPGGLGPGYDLKTHRFRVRFSWSSLSPVAWSIALIPGFVVFPLGAALLDSGAGYAQIAAFVSSLMAVGVITLPLEIKYFSKRTAILRNALHW